MSTDDLHPRYRPVRPREGQERLPRLHRGGNHTRNHPAWRGPYIHAPKHGGRAARVIVKTSWHPRGQRGFRSMTAATAYHIRYLRKEHDIGSEVDRAMYSPSQDHQSPEERTAFAARAREDHWQWHLVISPEQGKDLDMTQLTRDLMQQVEQDTGYQLDWLAANHYNTAHPHSHVILRGKDLEGLDVGFKRDYYQRGIPYRARDLATEQLALRLEQHQEQDHTRDRVRERDIEQERDRG